MINVHPSLLPRWRGAAPIERAIMAGDARDRRGDHARHRRAGTPAPVYALGARRRSTPDDDYGTLAAAAGDARRRPAGAGARRAPDAASSRTRRASPTRTRSARASARWTRRSRREEVERTIRALRPHIGSRLPLPDGTLPRRDRGRASTARRCAPAGGRVRTDGDAAAARLQRRRARADRDPPARRARDGRRRLAARPPRPGARSTSASTPRCPTATLDELLETRPRGVGRRRRRVAAARVRARRPRRRRDVLDAMVELRRRRRPARRASSPPTCSASSARPTPALPGRAGGRAARDGRARAATRDVLAGDRLRVRPPRRAARPGLAARASATTRTPTCARRVAFALGGRPGDDVARRADRALGRRGRRRPRLGDVRARHARRADDSRRCATRSPPASTTPTRTRAWRPSTASRCAATHARRGARPRPARRPRPRATSTASGRRHLLAETAEPPRRA